MHSHILNSKTKCCHSARLDCASFILPALVWPHSRLPRPIVCTLGASLSIHALHSRSSPACFKLRDQPDFLWLPGQLGLLKILVLCRHPSFAGVPAGPSSVNRSLRAVDPFAFPVDAVFSPFVATSSKPVDLKTHSCSVKNKQIHRHMASVPMQHHKIRADSGLQTKQEHLELTLHARLHWHRNSRLVAVVFGTACCSCGIGATVFGHRGYGALGLATDQHVTIHHASCHHSD